MTSLENSPIYSPSKYDFVRTRGHRMKLVPFNEDYEN